MALTKAGLKYLELGLLWRVGRVGNGVGDEDGDGGEEGADCGGVGEKGELGAGLEVVGEVVSVNEVVRGDGVRRGILGVDVEVGRITAVGTWEGAEVDGVRVKNSSTVGREIEEV